MPIENTKTLYIRRKKIWDIVVDMKTRAMVVITNQIIHMVVVIIRIQDIQDLIMLMVERIMKKQVIQNQIHHMVVVIMLLQDIINQITRMVVATMIQQVTQSKIIHMEAVIRAVQMVGNNS